MGLYTPAQAAYMARVPVQTISRWVHGSGQGAPAIRPQLSKDAEQTVTFLDFVQTMAIRAIRKEKKVPLAKIREFVDHVEHKFGIKYPFARPHTTYLFDDEIVLRHRGDIIQITGQYKDQDLIRPVVEIYMSDLHFVDDLAAFYIPMTGTQSRHILIDPHKRMGHPIVMPCGYSVQAILDAVMAEGTAENAAKAGGIDLEDVQLAQKYDDYLASIV